MHAAAIDAHHRLRQEARRETHLIGHLATDQLVKLDLIGGPDYVRIAVIDFELLRRDFRVVLLVLEAHGALDFGGRIDKRSQRIAGQ